MVRAGDIEDPRDDSCREDDLVECLGCDVLGVDGATQAHVHPRTRQLVAEVAQRLAELLLARNAPSDLELSTDRRGGIVENHLVSAFSSSQRERHSRRPGADDADPLASRDE